VGRLDAIQAGAGRNRQEKKGTFMKTRMLAVAVTLLFSTILAGQCRAQQSAQANIPFAFTVGDKTLPSGEYQIEAVLSVSDTVQSLRRSDGSVSMIALTTKADPKGKVTRTKLIFNCYGHEYFLSQIWSGDGVARQLRESRREKDLARGEAPNEVVLLLHAPTVQP
jgi:hypothetical protein